MTTDSELLRESIDRGTLGLWPVYEDYHIDDSDWLLPVKGAPHRVYSPLDHKELPSEIYKLHEGDIKGLLAFARRYGDFGLFGMARSHGSLSGVFIGDGLQFIWAHVRTVKLVADCIRILQDEDEPAATRLMRKITTVESDADGRKVNRLRLEVGVGWKPEITRLKYPDEAPPLELVAGLVRILLETNLLGVRRVPLVVEGYKIRSAIRFEAMLQAVYWMLLETAEGGEMVPCQNCRTPFIRTHKKQHYCPPRSGESESACSRKVRQERFKAK